MRCTFVIGFHRSGTSALTRVLDHMGVSVGEFDDLQTEENPLGFYEHPEFRAINDELLLSVDASWFDFTIKSSEFETVNGSAQTELMRRAVSLARKMADNHEHFALKDPRAMILIPFWRRVMHRANVKTDYLVIVRDPREVVDSQMKRQHLAPEFFAPVKNADSFYALWCSYHINFLDTFPASSFLTVDHNELLRQPDVTVESIARFLRITEKATIAKGASAIEQKLYRSSAHDALSLWGEAAVDFYSSFSPLYESPTRRMELLADLRGEMEYIRQYTAILQAAAPALKDLSRLKMRQK